MRALPVIAFALPMALAAQTPRAELDTAVLRIGEQVTLTLSLERYAGAGASVDWPGTGDTLMRHVQVVRSSPIDTIRATDNSGEADMLLVQELVITSFDSGFWAIPPFRFSVDGKMLETAPLLLEVRSVELDSSSAVRDIRDIIEPPFDLLYWIQDHALWLGGSVTLAVLAALLWWYLRRRPQGPVAPISSGPSLPLHQRILADLHALDNERLWQQGQHKAYHSRLTDLLRAYIEERYQVPALERTTDELLHELRVSPLNGDQRTQLANMLRLADMVKFAKALPAPAENEQMMAAAIRFVETTCSVDPNPASHA